MQPETPTPGYRCWLFLLDGIDPPARVLDVGCGHGEIIRELTQRGCSSVKGVEIDSGLVGQLQSQGYEVLAGAAEALPIPDCSVDVIVCSVVLPYTHDARAIAEWQRVLRPGGFVNMTTHGIGYGINYVARGSFRHRIYGLRMLLNTFVARTTGGRLPGFLGDTVCHSSRSLEERYAENGLRLVYEKEIEHVCGFPQFICHRVTKPVA